MSSVAPSPSPPKVNVLPLPWGLASAGTTGCIAWLVAHPFEIIKNRQVNLGEMRAPGTAAPGMRAAMADIVAKEGSKGFFTGLSAGLTRQVAYGSVRVGCFEPIKNTLTQGRRQATVLDRIVAGAAAGVLGAFCSSPVEVALVRISKAAAAKQAPPSLPKALADIAAASGVLGYWQGCTPLLTRAAFVGVAQVAFFDQCLHFLKSTEAVTSTMGPFYVNLLASVITGAFYSFVTMPIEVSRVRISGDTSKPRRYVTMLGTIKTITKEEGFFSMYKIYWPYLGRCGSHTVVQFVLLERFRTWYFSQR